MVIGNKPPQEDQSYTLVSYLCVVVHNKKASQTTSIIIISRCPHFPHGTTEFT